MSIDHDPAEPLLSPIEARILGCLMEKQRTTLEQYPLTLNALVTACNQKTARDPVLHLSPGEVGHAVRVLRDRGLVHETFAGRTERYDHKLAGHFLLNRQQQALLCMLLLRGPQTPGELRSNAARLAEFADLADVTRTLGELAQRQPPLVRELPRQPGMREQRYAQLLCGEPPAVGPVPAADADLAARVTTLEAEVAALRLAVDELRGR